MDFELEKQENSTNVENLQKNKEIEIKNIRKEIENLKKLKKVLF